MKSYLSKAKAAAHDFHHHHHNQDSSNPEKFPAHQKMAVNTTDQPSTIQQPSAGEILRYRYHHGTNVGSVFVLEQWLTPHMYPDGSQSAELAAVTSTIKQMGIDGAQAKFENHWNTFVSDADLDWLANTAHCTSIRLPIGYFTLGPAYCQHTPFAQAAQVYTNAWAAVKELVSRARSRGIGTLLDFHALPGGANGGDHSGTNSGKAELWGNHSNLDLALRCLLFIANEAKAWDGVIGIQLCNEADHGANGIYAFYDSALAQMGQIDKTMPIYISDAWDLGQASAYCNGKNSLSTGVANPLLVDTHLYWCFSDADKARTPQQICQDVGEKLSVLKDGNVVDHGACQVVVGEYSCVLAEDCWARCGGDSKADLVNAFGQTQSQRYQDKAGGSFFWTYRMDWMDGGEWGFAQQTQSGAIKPPASLALGNPDVQSRISNAQANQNSRMQATVSAHYQYWDTNHPGNYEHWRYENGWKVGFADAQAFFGSRVSGGLQGTGGDKIGCLDIWVKKRIVESGMAGPFVWEFEQGLRHGVRDFYALAEI
ncbi:Glucan 1,3-beta-glucosidase 3 [Elasticomyces elasticus]|nr:Glucan 1,3-beta-glucosidase 3 [Elasticomyces elasticus]